MKAYTKKVEVGIITAEYSCVQFTETESIEFDKWLNVRGKE